MKTSILFFATLLLAGLTGCDDNQPTPPATTDQATQPAQITDTTPATPLTACQRLTIDKLAKVYSDKQFRLEIERNDPATAEDTFSGCRYQESNKEIEQQYFVDLEIHTRASAKQAMELLIEAKHLDLEKKGKDLEGYADAAYFIAQPISAGGPSLQFVKDRVFFKLVIQTLDPQAVDALQNELLALGNLILN